MIEDLDMQLEALEWKMDYNRAKQERTLTALEMRAYRILKEATK